MKKILYALPFVVLSLQASANTSVFQSGVRLGVEGGYKYHSVKQSTDFKPAGAALVPPGEAEVNRKTATKHAGTIGAHLAYDWFIDEFYAAIETAYRYAPSSSTTTLMFINANNATITPETFKISQYHSHDISFNLHLGRLVTDCFLFYGIAGLRIGFFEQKVKIGNSSGLFQNDKRTDTEVGYAFGLGARYGLPCGWSTSLEGTYDSYGKIKASKNLLIPQAGTEGTTLIQNSKRPHMFNLVLKVSKTL